MEKESKARMELLVTVHQALDLLNVESIGKSDPYCRLKFADQEHRTRVIKNSLDPVVRVASDDPSACDCRGSGC